MVGIKQGLWHLHFKLSTKTGVMMHLQQPQSICKLSSRPWRYRCLYLRDGTASMVIPASKLSSYGSSEVTASQGIVISCIDQGQINGSGASEKARICFTELCLGAWWTFYRKKNKTCLYNRISTHLVASTIKTSVCLEQYRILRQQNEVERLFDRHNCF